MGKEILDIQKISQELSPPSLYYSDGEDVQIYYISDLHLSHHAQQYPSTAKMVADMVDQLYFSLDIRSDRKDKIIVFAGDMDSEKELVVSFFEKFMQKYRYTKYLLFKKENANLWGMSYNQFVAEFERAIEWDRIRLQKKKQALLQWIDYNKVFKRYSSKYELKQYLQSRWYSRRNLPSFVEYKVLEIFHLEEEIKTEEKALSNWKDAHHSEKNNPSPFSINQFDGKISLSDVFDIVFTLGNHECVPFATVEEAVNWYQTNLERLKIRVLHNNALQTNQCILYAGTGFAKYDPVHNAKTLICCPGFCREDEILQTNAFEAGYQQALNEARQKEKCFICVSHYPHTACLPHTDQEAIYISGHTHQNRYCRNENLVMYADNQVGYTKKNIAFKKATLGVVTNPYSKFNEGMSKTTVEEYLKFCWYIGEYVGEGNLLKQRCQKGQLYVLKQKGYYAFFILNPASGISIVDGGRTKKITRSTNLNWIEQSFETILKKYLKALLPLRRAQESISSKLKSFGFDGRIHGCIVDVDFYHHIMINPFDGTITYYYSPFFGIIQSFESFENLLTAMKSTSIKASTDDVKKINRAQKKLKALYAENHILVAKNDRLITQETEFKDGEFQQVSKSEGMYGISRRINPLQSLFSGCVLREFDVSLLNTIDETQKKRVYSYKGKVCFWNAKDFLVIDDDGRDCLTVLDVQDRSCRRVSLVRLKAAIDQKKACWITKSVKETEVHYPELSHFLDSNKMIDTEQIKYIESADAAEGAVRNQAGSDE